MPRHYMIFIGAKERTKWRSVWLLHYLFLRRRPPYLISSPAQAQTVQLTLWGPVIPVLVSESRKM